MPASKLKTAAGVDHDYNFLSAIERERERNQREIVDERGLFSEKELGQLDDPYSFRKQWFGENVHFHPVSAAPRQFGSDGEDSDADEGDGEGRSNSKHIPAKASQLTRQVRQRLAIENIEVVQMPVGMTRQRENTTCWNRRSRRIKWCVEWIVYGEGGEEGEEQLKKHTRIRHKALETTPLYKALGESMAWYKKGQHADDDAADEEDIELAQAERRSRVLIREVRDDRRQGGTGAAIMQDGESAAWPARTQYPTQNPFTRAWAGDAGATATSWQADEEVEARRRHRFYLLRPLTVAGRPRELIPVAPADGLGPALRGRTVLEYPTVYVLPPPPDSSSTAAPQLPEGHVLGSTGRRENTKRQSAAAKRKAGPGGDNQRQPSHKRQAVGEAGIPMRPSATGGGSSQRGRGGASAAPARGRGRGRGGRSQPAGRQWGGGDQDAEEGEVNSDGDEVVAAPRPRASTAAEANRADTSSSDPDSSSDEDEDARDGFWASSSSRPPNGGGVVVDDEDEGEENSDDGPPEEVASASAPTLGKGTKKPGTGLVDYGSDSEEESDEEEDRNDDLAALRPENPELVAGAIQEIVGLLS